MARAQLLLLAPTLLALAVAGAGAGCAHGNVGDAILMTGIALASSGVSRALGGCYAACPPGTTCNPATGMCDTLPCRGQCGPGQRCVLHPVEHCVLEKPAQMEIGRPVDQTGVLVPAARRAAARATRSAVTRSPAHCARARRRHTRTEVGRKASARAQRPERGRDGLW